MSDIPVLSDLASPSGKELGLARKDTEPSTTLGAVTTEAAEIFHYFPKLAMELRWMIWEFTLPEGRVVEVEWSKRTESLFCPTESAHNPCPMLQTCKESREYYLRQWGPLAPYFGSNPPSHSSMPSHITADIKVPIAYFNPKIDTLYVSYAGTGTRKDVLKAVSLISELRNLAISARCGFRFRLHAVTSVDCSEYAKPYIKMFNKLKHLEKLTLVTGDGLDYYGPWKKSCKGTIELYKDKGSLSYYIDRMASVLERASTEHLVKIDSLAISRGGRDMKEWHKDFRRQMVREFHERAQGRRNGIKP